MSPRHPLRLSRRAALGLALLATGGCTVGTDRSADAPSRQTPAPGQAGDLALVAEARGEIGAMLDLLGRTTTDHAVLAADLSPLVVLHTAHDNLLAESDAEPATSATAPPPVPQRAGRALTLVRRREAALGEELASLAARAESGPLARALASMSAGVAQHVVALAPGEALG